MCCNHRTHVIVISIVWLILTGLSALGFVVSTVGTFTIGSSNLKDLNQNDLNYIHLIVGIQAVMHIFLITSGILSIVGAVKNKKCLLVPFMISMALQILVCIGGGIYACVVLDKAGYNASALIFIIPLLIGIGISVYFLTIPIILYNELSSGEVGEVRPGMVLRTYTSPPYTALE